RRNALKLQVYSHVYQMGHAKQAGAEAIGDPDVPLAVDAEAAIVDSRLEVLDLARIRGGEARDVVDAAIGNPDTVLLVDAEMKWCRKRLAWFLFVALTYDTAFSGIAL